MDQRTDKFKLKTNAMTRDEKALAEYRARWTSGNQQFPRTYLGGSTTVAGVAEVKYPTANSAEEL